MPAGVNPSTAHSKEEVSMLCGMLTGNSVAEIGIGEDLVYFHWLIKDYSLCIELCPVLNQSLAFLRKRTLNEQTKPVQSFRINGVFGLGLKHNWSGFGSLQLF